MDTLWSAGSDEQIMSMNERDVHSAKWSWRSRAGSTPASACRTCKEQGYDVVTLFVDTGGVDAEERALHRSARDRARRGGARHRRRRPGDLGAAWSCRWCRAGSSTRAQYPLLCSDRYVIVEARAAPREARGHRAFAHGCTGMGNDQVRFDLAVRALGDVHASSRRSARSRTSTRKRAPTSRRVPRGARLLRCAPRREVHDQRQRARRDDVGLGDRRLRGAGRRRARLCAPRGVAARAAARRRSASSEGGRDARRRRAARPGAAGRASTRAFGAYGVGRGIYTGDTTIGLKGRIVFECPGIIALLVAHRALEEAVLTAHQNRSSRTSRRSGSSWSTRASSSSRSSAISRRSWRSSQAHVSGEVTLETQGAALRRGRGGVAAPAQARTPCTRSRPTGAWPRPRASSSCSAEHHAVGRGQRSIVRCVRRSSAI